MQVVSKAREATVGDNDIDITLICDTDRNWVITLIYGARMLCRLALQEADYGTGLEEAKEAGVMIEKAKTRLDYDDKELVAGVQLAEAIWCGVTAHTGMTFSDSVIFVALTSVGEFRTGSPYSRQAPAKCFDPSADGRRDIPFTVYLPPSGSCFVSTRRVARHWRSYRTRPLCS